jgi:serine/threonine-protein kinase HipA
VSGRSTRPNVAATAHQSPVAGVQSKISLTLLPDGRFALPREGIKVPTTHILKVPERRYGREARLEESSALLAAAVGLPVSIPTAMSLDGIDALLIERFDRHTANSVVTRLHQEDFAQVLGLPSELKYRRKGKPGRQFDVEAAIWILEQTADPEKARIDFLLATLFNLCIGNADNHAKNHALLYTAGSRHSFAPLHDLTPIRLDDRYTHELSYKLGEAAYFDELTGEDIATFVGQCGVEDIQRTLFRCIGRMKFGCWGTDASVWSPRCMRAPI